MSIRYTIRHNIPAALINAEDVNDSSTWDLNLLRKHELAETDEHDIVYRQHDGRIVNWAEAATQQAQRILGEIQGESDDIAQQMQDTQNMLQQTQTTAETLTRDAQAAANTATNKANEADAFASTATQAKNTAVSAAQKAKEWATKTDGMVEGENPDEDSDDEIIEIDYSAKYYANTASELVNNAFQTCDLLGSSHTRGETIPLSLTGYKWIVFEVSCRFTNNSINTNAMTLPAAYLITQCTSKKKFSIGVGSREDCVDFSFCFDTTNGVTDWMAEINYPTGIFSSMTFNVFGIK